MVASKPFAKKVKTAKPGAVIPVKKGDLTELNISDFAFIEEGKI